MSISVNKTVKILSLLFLICAGYSVAAQPLALDKCNITWTTQSSNSSESMPCGGGEVGLNVWVENGELLFYFSQSGTFDENNAMLKSGRIRVKLSPDPFTGNNFRQELVLREGFIRINAGDKAEIVIWVDVALPVIHVDIKTNNATRAEAIYESWRYIDRPSTGRANNANSYKWAPQGDVKTHKDEIVFENNGVTFYHRNKAEPSIFDITVHQQKLDSVKDQLYNPIRDLTFGGRFEGKGMKPDGIVSGKYQDTDFKGWKLKSNTASKLHNITLFLHSEQAPSLQHWTNNLQKTIKNARSAERTAFNASRKWWNQFWQRSFIMIDPDKPDELSAEWQAGRNYQLFRYMLGCNAYGKYPTKFNGGLFTYDPYFVDTSIRLTPDFRNWGGGTHTAQNQRLVYFPMIKSGDFEMMKPQFDFYMRIQKNAELRSKVYWGHDGACFTEQMENFGLPNPAEYGWNRPATFAIGVEYNAWLEYEWDTVLEFCLMMLENERCAGMDITGYIPFIESCLKFFDAHYQYLARQRGRKTFDENGHLVLYPGSGAETFKMAYNATSTIAALKTITTRLLELPEKYLGNEKRKSLDSFLQRIPPITFSEFNGKKTIAPAKFWERINNVESPQLYPVFPWGIYGIGKPHLDIAINTWKYDTNVIKFRSHVGWKQDNIFAARLGLAQEALKLTVAKLKNSGRRFPAFWGPGFDWTPDHNWGGSGMIGLQEMLLQDDGKKIYLFPAWPKHLDVHFRLHAPYETIIEAKLKDGKLQSLEVTPKAREKDIVNLLSVNTN
ncbi:MAG TPA: DUF5703 domain-containing protein [Chitinophagaceae bacterium]